MSKPMNNFQRIVQNSRTRFAVAVGAVMGAVYPLVRLATAELSPVAAASVSVGALATLAFGVAMVLQAVMKSDASHASE
jgi:hypothetical protein